MEHLYAGANISHKVVSSVSSPQIQTSHWSRGPVMVRRGPMVGLEVAHIRYDR